MANLSKEAVEWAVEIAKAGIATQPGTLITNPEIVATFIEVVATKIEQLTFGKS